TADAILTTATQAARPGDVLVVSIHWGSNWGFHVPREQVRFAHRLVDGGVHVVHGHSSHHPRPMEVYRGRLVLYGCGDTVNDYEGIRGHERFRGDLRLLHLATLAPDGELLRLRMAPLQARNLSLRHAATADVDWLRRTLDEAGAVFGSSIRRSADGWLDLALSGR
ncbi:MAG TPA: CapA family protein, partial [Jiangellales bacterium]|nr:CapA family protein [Jiangellales bacterium]